MGTYTITVDKDLVSGASHSNYPLFVDLSDMPAGFWSSVAVDGSDIAVYDSDDSTELYYDLVSIDTGTETGEMHVLVPSVSGSYDTVIYVHTDDTPTLDDATGVWADYFDVFHCNEASGDLVSATGNARAFYHAGTGSATYAQAGQLGPDSAVYINDNSGTQTNFFKSDNHDYGGTTDWTISAWAKIAITADEFESLVYFGYPNGPLIRSHPLAGNDELYLSKGNIVYNIGTELATRFDGSAWTYFFNSTDADGTAYASLDDETAQTTSGSALNYQSFRESYIGNDGGEDASENIKSAYVDEIRFRGDALTDAWRLTEYANQNSPATFYATAEVGGGGSVKTTTAALSGAGTLTAIAVKIAVASTAFSGVGTLSVAPVKIAVSSAALSGVGTLGVTATSVSSVIKTTTAAFSGAGTVAVVPVKIAVAQAAFAGTGTLSTTATSVGGALFTIASDNGSLKLYNNGTSWFSI